MGFNMGINDGLILNLISLVWAFVLCNNFDDETYHGPTLIKGRDASPKTQKKN